MTFWPTAAVAIPRTSRAMSAPDVVPVRDCLAIGILLTLNGDEHFIGSPQHRPLALAALPLEALRAHVGTDRRGMVHSVTATHAAASDLSQLPSLLHGEESAIYGDQAYWKAEDRETFEKAGIRYRVDRPHPRGNKALGERWLGRHADGSGCSECSTPMERWAIRAWASGGPLATRGPDAVLPQLAPR